MPFAFDRVRPLAVAVPRVVRKQAEKAEKALCRPGDFAEGVHVARTSNKRLRGLLRLLEPELGSRYATEEKKLERIQKALGPLRDAHVVLETFDALFGSKRKRSARSPQAPALVEVRAALESGALAAQLAADVPARVASALSQFRKLSRRAKRWTPRHAKRDGGFAAIERGLEGTYRRVREARDAAYRMPTVDAFHAFRKAVKYHGHHLKLLSDIEPEEMAARLRDNDELGDLLGKDHDLAVLAEVLETLKSRFPDARQFRSAMDAIERSQRRLRKDAERLGTRLFAESPAAFRCRIRALFRAWREMAPPTETAEPQ